MPNNSTYHCTVFICYISYTVSRVIFNRSLTFFPPHRDFFHMALLHVSQMQMNFSTVFLIHLFIYLFIDLFVYLFIYLLFISSLFFSACQFRVLSQDFQVSCDNQINKTGVIKNRLSYYLCLVNKIVWKSVLTSVV